jgi:hypothetical protein
VGWGSATCNRLGWGVRFLWRARSGKAPVESPDPVPVESPDQVRGEPGGGARARRPCLVEWRSATDPDSPRTPPAATEPGVRISLGTATKTDCFRPGACSIFWSQPTRTLHVPPAANEPGVRISPGINTVMQIYLFFSGPSWFGSPPCKPRKPLRGEPGPGFLLGESGTWRATAAGLSTSQRKRALHKASSAHHCCGEPGPGGGAVESPARNGPWRATAAGLSTRPRDRALHEARAASPCRGEPSP